MTSYFAFKYQYRVGLLISLAISSSFHNGTIQWWLPSYFTKLPWMWSKRPFNRLHPGQLHHSLTIQSRIPPPWLLQPLQGPGLFLSSVINFYTDVRTPWTSDKPVARPLPIHRPTQTQNKRIHRHPCLEWDSNPQSQRSSERRQFMP
jgi:hypothetical protein